MSAFVDADGKGESETKGFNPNSITLHWGTGSSEIQKLTEASFSYILLYYQLGLTVFRDHKNALLQASSQLMNTSQSPLWKWSLLFKTNDLKLIKQIFTRQYILNYDKEYIEVVLERMIVLFQTANKHSGWSYRHSILSLEVVVELISRLSINATPTIWIPFLREFDVATTSMTESALTHNSRYFNCVYSQFKFYINRDILVELYDLLIKMPSNDCDPMQLNNYIRCSDIEPTDKDVLNLIREIKEGDVTHRDQALLRIELIEDSEKFQGYKQNLINSIWKNDDEMPKTGIFFPFAWERFPHKDSIDFSGEYKKNLLSWQFHYEVNGGVISSYSNTSSDVLNFRQFLFKTLNISNSDVTKINWSSEDFVNIISKLINYVANEKKKLEYNGLFGTRESTISIFEHVADIACFIGAESMMTHITDSSMWLKLESLYTELNSLDIFSVHLLTVLEIQKYTKITSETKNLLEQQWCSAKDHIAAAVFLSLSVIYLNDIKNKSWVIDLLNEILIILPYLDSKYLRQILQVISIPLDSIDISEDIAQRIARCIRTTFDSLSDRWKNIKYGALDGFLLDSMQNLSMFTKTICKRIKDNDLQVPLDIANTIALFKESKLPEVKNTWADYVE